jgi:hypothetical protein
MNAQRRFCRLMIIALLALNSILLSFSGAARPS